MVPPLEALLAAAGAGHLEDVRRALGRGADINGRDPAGYVETGKPAKLVFRGGKTALYLATANGHVELVRELLAAGADANILSEKSAFTNGQAPLHAAATAGHVELVKMLLEGGAKPGLKEAGRPDIPGKTAAELAASAGHAEIVMLLQASTPQRAGEAKAIATKALCSAVEKGHVSLVKDLLAQGADPHAVNKSAHCSALMMACIHGFVEITGLLLDQGGRDLNAADSRGRTPLTMTVQGAAMSPETNEGVASPRDHIGVMKLLLERGAGINVPSLTEGSALHIARSDSIFSPRMKKVASFLEEAGGLDFSNGAPLETVPLPDLSKAAQSAAFVDAVEELTGLLGKPCEGFAEIKHAVFFKTTLKKAAAFVAAEQGRFLKGGIFICRTGESHMDNDCHVAVFPTADKHQVLALFGTGGMFEGSAAAIRRLKSIEKTDPFTLSFISMDTVEGEFVTLPKAPGRLAKQLYELCPDIVDQGVGSPAMLAKELKKSKKLFLWWD